MPLKVLGYLKILFVWFINQLSVGTGFAGSDCLHLREENYECLLNLFKIVQQG